MGKWFEFWNGGGGDWASDWGWIGFGGLMGEKGNSCLVLDSLPLFFFRFNARSLTLRYLP